MEREKHEICGMGGLIAAGSCKSPGDIDRKEAEQSAYILKTCSLLQELAKHNRV